MPSFTYTSAIPAANDIPSQSQSQMQVNCTSVNNILNVDLIGFNNSNGGFHQKSTYVVQGSDPGSSSAQVVEYSKAVSASSELFIQRDGVSTPIQMTSGTAASGGNTAKSINNGQSFIPGPFLVKFGTSIQNATSRTIVFTTDANLTAFNNIFSVFVSPLSSVDTAKVTSVSATQFSITTSTGPLTVYWLAIGN